MNTRGKIFIALGLVAMFSVAYFLGSYDCHSVLADSSTTTYGPDFASPMPFRAFTMEYCSPFDMPIPDEHRCIVELANSTADESTTLAAKLSTLPINPDKDITPIIQRAGKAMRAFMDDVCNLDAIRFPGGTGSRIDPVACRYYYEKQYLDILKEVERTMAQ